MQERFATNLLTGLFLVVVAAAAIALLLFFQGYRGPAEGDVYYLVFDSASKIKPNSQVEVSGRKVGVVESIAIQQERGGAAQNYATVTQVRLKVRLAPEFRSSLTIYSNAYAEVVPNFFGGSVVSITPGGEAAGLEDYEGEVYALKPAEEQLLDGSNTIPGMPSTNMNDVMARANDAAENIAVITAEMKDLLTDKETRANLETAISSITNTMQELSELMTNEIRPAIEENLQVMAEETRSILERTDTMLEQNQENIQAITENMRTVSENAAEFSDQHMDQLGDKLQKVLTQMDEMTTTLNEILLDNRGNIDQSMVNLRKATQELSQMMTKLRRDPSIALWGTNADDNSADVEPDSSNPQVDEKKLRDRGHLPPQPRDD